VVLPAAPEDVAFEGNRDPDARFGEFLQARAVTRIGAAFGARAFFASPARPAWQTASRYRRDNLHGAPIVYVHAKIAAFDGQRALVSSANLNGRSLHWDTEAGVMMDDPALARQLLERCLGHWRQDADWTLIAGDGASVVAEIRAAAQADRARSPAERRSLILPYAVGPARRFGRNLPGLPEAMV